MGMVKKQSISEALRRIILDADESRYQIARETGILQSTLCRFVHGGEARGTTLDTLAAYFDLELRPVKRKGKGK